MSTSYFRSASLERVPLNDSRRFRRSGEKHKIVEFVRVEMATGPRDHCNDAACHRQVGMPALLDGIHNDALWNDDAAVVLRRTSHRCMRRSAILKCPRPGPPFRGQPTKIAEVPAQPSAIMPSRFVSQSRHAGVSFGPPQSS